MFLHEHNLPFLLMDHLPKLVASACPDSKIAKAIKCCRTKAMNLTKDVIAKEQISVISENLKNCVFSIIIDETTDINTEKSLAIVVRFYDNDKCKDRFLGLIKVQSRTANDIFTAICNFFKEKNIPVTNMIGLAADNASVMMGNINGVQARFKAIIPHLFILGCVCHSFHLCSSAAAKKLPRSLEDLIRAVYSYFSHSSNRSGRLQEFQIFVELKPRKLLHPSATRWLSIQAAVDRVLQNWEALILFFTHECFEDDLPATQTILNQLKNPIFKSTILGAERVAVATEQRNGGATNKERKPELRSRELRPDISYTFLLFVSTGIAFSRRGVARRTSTTAAATVAQSSSQADAPAGAGGAPQNIKRAISSEQTSQRGAPSARCLPESTDVVARRSELQNPHRLPWTA
ncbi:uncharacterized protein LOC124299522 [Neodiprion virginianus]|uniref:uncharacterized protein LOC124299522 n=1 Tax=Neodiprion virginianus TaxID=2961670 RepID=UPI001EE69900|nr:uncharacterized protein LOC124299522 [Neodiprion virginianus]